MYASRPPTTRERTDVGTPSDSSQVAASRHDDPGSRNSPVRCWRHLNRGAGVGRWTQAHGPCALLGGPGRKCDGHDVQQVHGAITPHPGDDLSVSYKLVPLSWDDGGPRCLAGGRRIGPDRRRQSVALRWRQWVSRVEHKLSATLLHGAYELTDEPPEAHRQPLPFRTRIWPKESDGPTALS